MKKMILITTLLLSASAYAAGIPGAPTGTVTSAESADVFSPLTTLNASCATPATGCSAGQFASVKLGGRGSVTATIVNSALTATIAAYISSDRGVTWTQTSIRNGVGTVGTAGTTVVFSASSATSQVAIFIPYGGVTDAMLIFSAFTSGSATAILLASNSPAAPLPLLVFPKGTQTNGNGLSVQPLKDAGRTYVVIGADGVTPAIAETVITFTKTVADTQTTAQTTYTITNAKTFRIQSVCASFTAGATANRVRVALRLNTGGACVAGSNILLPVIELAPNFGTATAAEGGAIGCVTIPDGLEIAGNGTKAICLSESATAATGTLTTNLIGFEY